MLKLKSLQITPIAGGYAITEIDRGEYVSLSETVAIREKLGEPYSYPRDPDTVIGFVRQYLEAQEKANTPPETS